MISQFHSKLWFQHCQLSWDLFLKSMDPLTTFRPENPFLKLQPTSSVKLVSYVVKGVKIKISAKFCALRQLRFEITKRTMSPSECSQKVSGLSRNRSLVWLKMERMGREGYKNIVSPTHSATRLIFIPISGILPSLNLFSAWIHILLLRRADCHAIIGLDFFIG